MEMIHYIKLANDITDRVETDKKLRESEVYNKSIIKAIPDIIIKFNGKGDYLDIISNDESKLFIEKEKLINKNITEVFSEEKSYEVMSKFETSLETKSLTTIEYKLNVGAGLYWFEGRIVPLNQKEVIVLIRDITERKQREDKIHKYTMELELAQMELEELYGQLDQQIFNNFYIML
jgi:PAS domain S-box-containing protein